MIDGYAKYNYGAFFKGLVLIYKPKELIEIGIGKGFTLERILSGVKENGFGHVRAYDIFEKWPYYHQSNYDEIISKYKEVEIINGDFFEVYKTLDNNSIDFFNIDVAMDGFKYEFFFKYYLSKLTKNGIAILEGGSEERDNVDWMKKFNKKSIVDFLKDKKNCFVIQPFPSLTMVKR